MTYLRVITFVHYINHRFMYVILLQCIIHITAALEYNVNSALQLKYENNLWTAMCTGLMANKTEQWLKPTIK